MKSKEATKPCHTNLRSICWKVCLLDMSSIDFKVDRYKVFLLFRSVSRANWSAVLTDSRDGYGALREHFLRNIEHPDEIESTADPLSDNQNVCSHPLTALHRV